MIYSKSITTVEKWLKQANHILKKASISSHNLDSLIILEHVLATDRARLLAHPEMPIPVDHQEKLTQLLTRRSKREPIAYLIGCKEFYGRRFEVNNDCLIPRPESESFINLLKKHLITKQTVVDVGCGSGILGITCKLELPTNTVTLSDISASALQIARQNAKVLKASCLFQQANLVPANNNFSVILANLPYVPTDQALQPELKYEPSLALFAGNDGLMVYECFWQQIKHSPATIYVLTESLLTQHNSVERLAMSAGFSLLDSDGLVQLFIKNRQ